MSTVINFAVTDVTGVITQEVPPELEEEVLVCVRG